MILIGVDGGGTSTRAVVCNQSAQIMGRGHSGSSNIYSVGEPQAIANILSAVNAALLEANLGTNDVNGWGLGLGGAVSEREHSLIRTQLQPHAGNARIVVEEDAVAALAGAFGWDSNPEGAILIAGTGANCFGQNAHGERARIDGLGSLLGDRGSGYSIGEACLRNACRSVEGLGPTTNLGEATLAHFGVRDLNELVGVVYAPDFARDRVASLFPVVCQAYVDGDRIARDILSLAALELFDTAATVLKRLKISRLALCGGLLENQTPVRECLEEMFANEMPHIELQAPQFEPVIGAAILGHRALN